MIPKEYPVTYLKACSKKDLPSNTIVINKDEFEYYTWVKVPSVIAHEFQLYDVEEMEEPPKQLDVNEACSHTPGHPWYRFLSSKLCKCPGLHVYRMHMVNVFNSDVVSVFFAYTVQDDDPKKPYIYMDRDDDCACQNKDRIEF